MKLRHLFTWVFTATLIAWAGIVAAQNTSTTPAMTTKPVYVPDFSHESDHLSDTAIKWDATMLTTNVPADTSSAHFVFNFMNVSPDNVIFGTVHPSCGCTTAQLPPLPWTIFAGTNSQQIGVTVNLAGKFGTVVKTVHVGTDHGSRELIVQIDILPLVITNLTDAQRQEQMAIAKIDRQAVFKNDCVTCHVRPGQFKYGKDLYDADCGICHDAVHRASMVPDLHNLKVATNQDFWRTWIAHGKAGSFMPAFSTGDGGPLTDMQIASLAAYLSSAIPSKVPSPQ